MPDCLATSRDASLRQPVVLIVGDHEDSVAMYACGLLMMGFAPVTAETADDAFARTCDVKPDVIVADITRPGVSGVDLARRLRRDGRTKDARIILLTSHASAAVERQAYDAGCDRFVVKPCLPDALTLQIEDVLNGHDHETR